MNSNRGTKDLDPIVKTFLYRRKSNHKMIKRFIKEQNDYPRIPERISRQNLKAVDSYEGEF